MRQLNPHPAPVHFCTFLVLLFGCLLPVGRVAAQLRPSQQTAIEDVEKRTKELKEINKSIWNFAEVGYQEERSSALLQGELRSAGFDIEAGVAQMPTAFVASYGSGEPVQAFTWLICRILPTPDRSAALINAGISSGFLRSAS